MLRTAGYTAPVRASWAFTNQANAFQNLMVRPAAAHCLCLCVCMIVYYVSVCTPLSLSVHLSLSVPLCLCLSHPRQLSESCGARPLCPCPSASDCLCRCVLYLCVRLCLCLYLRPCISLNASISVCAHMLLLVPSSTSSNTDNFDHCFDDCARWQVTANVCMCGTDGTFDSMGEGMICNFDGEVLVR